MSRKKKPECDSWLVRYEVTYRGETVVDAESQEAAEAIVDGGGFEDDASQERVDWKRFGTAKENK